jgi:hypothetical protein
MIHRARRVLHQRKRERDGGMARGRMRRAGHWRISLRAGVQQAAAIVTAGGVLPSRGPISHRLKIPLAKVRRFP